MGEGGSVRKILMLILTLRYCGPRQKYINAVKINVSILWARWSRQENINVNINDVKINVRICRPG